MAEDNLEPVEGNPFEQPGLEPVQGNPFKAPVTAAGEITPTPKAFADRIALGKQMSEGAARVKKLTDAFGEGTGTPTPTGLDDDTLDALIHAGFLHDPDNGKPGPLRLASEAVVMPAAKAWDSLMRTANGALHVFATGAQQMAQDNYIAEPGDNNRVKNEIINLGNYLMTNSMAEVGRMHMGKDGPSDQTVGGTPKAQDFTNAAKVLVEDKNSTLSQVKTEAALRALWEDHGIHPAEAATDAAAKGWMKYTIDHPIETFHGTPHSFSSFSMDKIGTGEGAQTYGHGLYFAQERGVAEHYADTVVGNKPNLYRVRIHANEAELMPHDDYVPPEMKEKIAQAILDRPDVNGSHAYANGVLRADAHIKGNEIYDALSDQLATNGTPFDPQGPSRFVRNVRDDGQEQASKFLREAGIPGLKYLDEASRYVDDMPKMQKFVDELKVEREAAVQRASEATDANIKRYADKNVARIDADIAGLEKSMAIGKGEKPPTRNIVLFDDKLAEITHVNDEAVGGEPVLPHDLGAAANVNIDLPSYEEAPRPAPGQVREAATKAIAHFTDIGTNLQELLAPMARSPGYAAAIIKDAANALRRINWEFARADQNIMKKHPVAADRERMWNALNEESEAAQLGESTEHQGLVTLTPAERDTITEESARGNLAFAQAHDLGMIEGEGIPFYAPRMMVNMLDFLEGKGPMILNARGGITKSSPGLLKRKHLSAEETEAAGKARLGQSAQIVRDIRTLPLATARLERAIAGRTLINSIEDAGARTGQPTVIRGDLPAGADPADWYTDPTNPAFMKYRPMYARDANGMPVLEGNAIKTLKDEDGNLIYERVPIHIHKDFKGGLDAIQTQKSGAFYQNAMALKGKVMSLIMFSPLMHNLVEFGRAFPAMPGKFIRGQVYSRGKMVIADADQMKEFINNGLVPIGKRFFNQDITGILETPSMEVGTSTTAKVLAFVPGLFDEAAGTAVKQAIDKAGDFWHNKLLWDQVAKLQMGLAHHFREDAMAAGMDRVTAIRYAAHFANRFAGALPQEAMSSAATKIANSLLFSRSYTLGNLGVMKDMFTGMPKDVLAQIERDAGPEAMKFAKSFAKRKAQSAVVLDSVLALAGTSVLANVFNVMLNDSTVENEFKGYIRRVQEIAHDVKEHPFAALRPWNAISEIRKLSATHDNEPGKQSRLHVGNTADGMGIYVTNPVGRVGEEFMDWATGPMDQLKRKLGTYAKPVLEWASNDQGFGRKVTDPSNELDGHDIQNAYNIAKLFIEAQLPEGQMSAAGRLLRGEKNMGFNAAQLLAPIAGISVSKGAPGGPAVGEYYHAKEMQTYQIQTQTNDIRKQIESGDIAGARERMTKIGMNKGYQNWIVKTTINPALRLNNKTAADLYRGLPQAQQDRLTRARGQ